MAETTAKRCDGCERLEYTVRPYALIVAGKVAVERDLCRACGGEAKDAFMRAVAGWRATARGIAPMGRPVTLLERRSGA